MRRGRAAMHGLSIALLLATTLPATTGTREPATARESEKPQPADSALAAHELLLDMRALSEMHNQAVRGTQDALRRQVDLANAINRRLAQKEAEGWSDPRWRRAVSKFVVGGGDPAILSRLVQAKAFPPEDLPLAQGLLDYAYGRHAEAAEQLAGIEARSLEPGMAGHLALVQAIIAQDRDLQRVVELCDEARALAPGTGVEEAALRLALNAAIASGDQVRFERYVRLYLQRFPNSVYAGGAHVRIAGVVALLGDQSTEHARDRIARLSAITPQDLRALMLGEVANAAIRSGRMLVAELAARAALEATPPDRRSQRAALLAIEGAALVAGPQRAAGVQRLEAASELAPDPETAELIAVAGRLVDSILSPSSPGEPAQATNNVQGAEADRSARGMGVSPTIERLKGLAAKAELRLAEVDGLLNERVIDGTKAIGP